jgi:hypothetical protein
MAQQAATQSLRSAFPTQHQTAFDLAMAQAPDIASEVQATGIISNLIALIKAMGLTVNFGCIISVIPQILAAIAAGGLNPLAWLAVIQAYWACSHPTPVPTP